MVVIYTVLFKRILLVFSALLVFSCSDNDSPPEPVNNQYELEGSIFMIETEFYRESSGSQGGVEQIRLMEPLPDSALYDIIIISPVPGPSSIEGSYVYSKTEDIGTYELVFIHATDGVETTEWYTNGDNGASLEIKAMGKKDGKEIYRVLIPEFTLNYGYWDYLAGKWVSLGQKVFRLSYEGPVLD